MGSGIPFQQKQIHMDYKPRMLLIPESGLWPADAAFIYRYLCIEVTQRWSKQPASMKEARFKGI